MSTGYTIGGDTWYNTYWGKPGGQTFHVPKPVNLHYIKVYAYRPHEKEGTRITIKSANGDHEPFGNTLAVAVILKEDFPPKVEEAWIQKQLSSSINAIPEEYFVILLESMTPWLNKGKWCYDAANATYLGGRRIHSEDGGNTWIQHPNDDHMFYIWGTPPAPPPPPKQPPNKWAPLSISQQTVLGGFIITIITDTPCHLKLYWTLAPPWAHSITRILRGLAVPWYTYWCFVKHRMIDQEEPGDTTTHTFIWLGWEVCQTKYFRFHGTISTGASSSDSPIFHKHYAGWPTTLICFEEWSK